MHHTVAVRRRTTLLTALALGLLVAACANDGRTLAPTRPGQTTTTTGVPVLGAAGDPVVFTLASAAAADGGELPVRYTCFGDSVSPPVGWTNIPPETTSLALVVRDRDADGFVHWVVTGIDPTTEGFSDGGLTEGVVEQVNSTGAIGWEPPCPPEGGGRHIYDLTLYAVQSPIEIDPGLPADDAAKVVETTPSITASLSLTVTPPASGVGSTEP